MSPPRFGAEDRENVFAEGVLKMTEWLEEGQNATDFTLLADDGNEVTLSDFQGSPVVLFFYPKDDTPG
jgi:peroxiredoxin